MNDFDKTFVLRFYNSFVKIELNSDNDIMLILRTCNLQNKMLLNSVCVLIYSLTKCVPDGFKDSCSNYKNFVKLAKICL